MPLHKLFWQRLTGHCNLQLVARAVGQVSRRCFLLLDGSVSLTMAAGAAGCTASAAVSTASAAVSTAAVRSTSADGPTASKTTGTPVLASCDAQLITSGVQELPVSPQVPPQHMVPQCGSEDAGRVVQQSNWGPNHGAQPMFAQPHSAHHGVLSVNTEDLDVAPSGRGRTPSSVSPNP